MNETKTNIDLGQIANQYSEFGLHVHEGFTVIRIFDPLTDLSFEALYEATTSLFTINAQPIIFDCSEQTELNSFWTKFLLSVVSLLEPSGTKITAINCGPEMQSYLQKQNLTPAIPALPSWKEAMAYLGVESKIPLETGIMNPFIAAAMGVIEKQMRMNSGRGKPLAFPANSSLDGDISGLVDLDCGSFKALVVLSFPQATILKMVERITGEVPPNMDNMVKSSVGEITNVVFTRGKKKLNEMGYGIKSAIPKVVNTHDLPAEYEKFSGEALKVPFSTEFGDYFAEIRLAA